MLDNTQQSLAEKTIELLNEIVLWQGGIEAALSYANGSHTFDDVVKKILTGEVHFFSYPDCFVIMQVILYPQYKTYHCFLAGGNQKALDKVLDEMTANAKHFDCRYLSLSGRHGWVRRLKTRGWQHTFSTMYLEL